MNALGVTWVEPEELPKISKGDNRQIYATIVHTHHHLYHPDDSSKSFPVVGGENWEHFVQNNSSYRSNFAETIAPHMSCLINCLFWAPGDPKILTNEDLRNLLNNETRTSNAPGVPYLPQKLTVISDISADLNGSLEFIKKCTSVDEPFEILSNDATTSTS